MVAVYHIWLHRVSGGADVFFVVAGYFAAGSIMKITAQPNVRAGLRALAQYWLRTARRVVPSATVIIVATVGASMMFLPRSHWKAAIADGWASLAFSQNWHLAQTGADYLLDGVTASPFQQFWALALQVQSYITYPLIALLALGLAHLIRARHRTVLLLLVAACLITSMLWSIGLTAENQPVAYFHLGTRMWEFLAGTLLALLLRSPVHKVLGQWLGWVGLLVVIGFAAAVDASDRLPGLFALVPVLGAMSIITSSFSGADPRVLRWEPFLRFADSSFAFYLWHWPLLVLYRWRFGEAVSMAGGLAILGASAGLAWATTKLVESPVRRSKRLKASAVRTLVVCLLLALLAASSLVVWQFRTSVQEVRDWSAVSRVLDGAMPSDGEIVPSPAIARQDRSVVYDSDCQQGTRPAEVKTCLYGDVDGDITIALVGASQDTQWLDLIDDIADEAGARVLLMTKGACPFGDMGAIDFVVDPSCPIWSQALIAQLEDNPPDLVITMATRRSSGGDSIPDWKMSYFERLSRAGVPVLGMRANPSFGLDVPACVEAEGAEACAVPRDQVLSPSSDLAVPDLPGFTFLDLGATYCGPEDCPAVMNGILVSWDGGHLTRTWTFTFGAGVRESVLDVLSDL